MTTTTTGAATTTINNSGTFISYNAQVQRQIDAAGTVRSADEVKRDECRAVKFAVSLCTGLSARYSTYL